MSDQTAASASGGMAKQDNHMIRGIICAALGGTCWGFSGTCVQLLSSSMGVPVPWIICVRLCAGSLLFLLVCLAREPKNLLAALRDKKSMVTIVLFSIFGVALTQFSYLTTISYTNAGTGTVLERLGLLFILGFVCIRGRRFPTAKELIGLVLALVGVFVIATKGDFSTLKIPLEGLLWGIATAFAMACYTLIPGKVLSKWGSFVVTGLAMLLAGVGSSLFVQPWALGVQASPALISVMVAMVLVGTLGAYALYLQGVRDAGPVLAGLVGCAEPVSATIISAVWLGTVVTPADLLGCALIIGMVFLVTDRSNGKTDHPTWLLGDDALMTGPAWKLGYYKARHATKDDYEAMRKLANQAHSDMQRMGIREGIKRYPSSRRLMKSLEQGLSFVVVRETDPLIDDKHAGPFDDQVIGMFGFALGSDPLYEKCEGAQWLTEKDGQRPPLYAVLHWVAVDELVRRSGVGSYIIETAEHLARNAGAKSIRMDVYPDNAPMIAFLEANGYQPCGTVMVNRGMGGQRERTLFEKAW